MAIGIGVLSYAALLVASPERRRPATETVAAALS
jgi:hypothetical protein